MTENVYFFTHFTRTDIEKLEFIYLKIIVINFESF